jgi:tRNA A37 threonylcarbamoyladenosine biosynthesis protein TsaE
VAVEWAEKASSLLPEGTITVSFERTAGGGRKITISRT